MATKDYLRNLHARGVRKDEILTSSTLMLLDQNNMTRQYIDDYLQENHIVVHDSIDISSMDLLIDFARIGEINHQKLRAGRSRLRCPRGDSTRHSDSQARGWFRLPHQQQTFQIAQ